MLNFFLFRKKRFQILTFSFVVGIFVLLSLMMFVNQQKNSIEDNFWISLEEVLLQQRSSIENIYKSQENMLKAAANYIAENEKYTRKEEILAVLQRFEKESKFESAFYTYANGISLSSTGTEIDIHEELFFKEAFGDQNTQAAPEKSLIDNSDIGIITVPLKNKDGKTYGIMGGTISMQYINSLIIESFGSKGYAFILSPDNMLVAQTSNANISKEEQNIAFKTIQNIGLKGKLTYSYNGIKRYMAYTQLSVNDWTLISIVPSNALADKSISIFHSMFFATFLNFVVFVLLITLLVLLHSRHTRDLSREAFFDKVTGGITLQKFLMEADRFCSSNRDKKMIAICLDINDFRIINDLYGFKEGNNVLKLVHDALKKQIGTGGLLCRVSNDMFYILQKVVTSEDALISGQSSFSDKFNALIEKNGKHYRVSFTFGFYVVEKNETSTPSIFERANHVHNKAKKEGVKNIFIRIIFVKVQ